MAHQPTWQKLKGTRRVAAEFKYIGEQIACGALHGVSDLQVVGDDITRWRFHLKGFDNALPGGAYLNADLAELQRRHGQDYILMEIKFPNDYPQDPFFLRVIRPRMMWYTGHVTAGGSICIEALTQCGTSSSWQSMYCVESILNMVTTNMIDCDTYYVKTAAGGGLTGSLRVDLDNAYAKSGPMVDYSEYEAQSAFQRMMTHHRTNGWGPAFSPAPPAPSQAIPDFYPSALIGGSSSKAAAPNAASGSGNAVSHFLKTLLPSRKRNSSCADKAEGRTGSPLKRQSAGRQEEEEEAYDSDAYANSYADADSGRDDNSDGGAEQEDCDSDDVASQNDDVACLTEETLFNEAALGYLFEDAISDAAGEEPDHFQPINKRSVYLVLPTDGLLGMCRHALGIPSAKPIVVRIQAQGPSLGFGAIPLYEVTYDYPLEKGKKLEVEEGAVLHEGSKVVFQLSGMLDTYLKTAWSEMATDLSVSVMFFKHLHAFLSHNLFCLGNYCVICGADMALCGLKPVACDDPMCTHKYDELGLGTDMSELYHAPEVTDLLISLAAAAAGAEPATLRETLFVRAPADFLQWPEVDHAGPSNYELSTLNSALKRKPMIMWDDLRHVLSMLPSVADMAAAKDLQALLKEIDSRAYRLLRWVLATNRGHLVKLRPDEQCPQMGGVAQFKLFTNTPQRELKFQELKKKYGSRYAFHGSGFHNWHSILRTSLKNCSNTALMRCGAAHGSGIYLALSSSISSSYTGRGGSYGTWSNSKFGCSPCCLAICEVVNMPANKHNSWGSGSGILVVPEQDAVATRYFCVYNSSSEIPATEADKLVFPAPSAY